MLCCPASFGRGLFALCWLRVLLTSDTFFSGGSFMQLSLIFFFEIIILERHCCCFCCMYWKNTCLLCFESGKRDPSGASIHSPRVCPTVMLWAGRLLWELFSAAWCPDPVLQVNQSENYVLGSDGKFTAAPVLSVLAGWPCCASTEPNEMDGSKWLNSYWRRCCKVSVLFVTGFVGLPWS